MLIQDQGDPLHLDRTLGLAEHYHSLLALMLQHHPNAVRAQSDSGIRSRCYQKFGISQEAAVGTHSHRIGDPTLYLQSCVGTLTHVVHTRDPLDGTITRSSWQIRT